MPKFNFENLIVDIFAHVVQSHLVWVYVAVSSSLWLQPHHLKGMLAPTEAQKQNEITQTIKSRQVQYYTIENSLAKLGKVHP